MKKILIYSIILFMILIIIKYGFSNYKMEYSIDGYNIKTIYKNNRFYYEIEKNGRIYNFDYYANRGFKKEKINKIELIKDDNYECIYPIKKNGKTYPLCYIDNEFVDYNLINSEQLSRFKKINNEIKKPVKDFEYYNNLNKDEYIAVWNYKGYIIINHDNYENVDLFSKDKYDNSLAILYKNYIYMADNDQEHEFSNLVKLNVKTKSFEKIKLNYNIDFDSYFVGVVNNNLYIYDNKYSILYELNLKNNKMNILSNTEKGFVKYENGKFVTCSKSEYKVNKISFNNYKSNYTYEVNNSVYKIINNNKKIKQKILNEEVKLIKEYNNKLFYILGDYLYQYDPINGSNVVLYNYELNFNSENTIFVYNE